MAGVALSLDQFKDEHGLDEKCSRALEDLSSGDQLVVMDIVIHKQSGDQPLKNVSAFTWSIVKKMQTQPGSLKLEFVQRQLDEKCADAFQKLPMPAKEMISIGVDASKCRNISAFVWSKVRSMQSGMQEAWSSPPVAAPVPRLRSRTPVPAPHDLSRRSTEGLLAEMENLQRELANRQAGIQRARTPRAPVSGPVLGGGLLPAAQQLAMQQQLDQNAREALSSLDEEGQTVFCGLFVKQTARNPSALTWALVKRLRERPEEAKAEFIRDALDDQASQAFDSCPPEVQRELVSSVDVVRTRNLSATIWSRIRKGEVPIAQEPAPAISPGKGSKRVLSANSRGSKVGNVKNALDERCRAELESLPAALQQQVLQEVTAECRNPSAFVWSKVKALRSTGAVSATPRGDERTLALDEKCSAELFALPEDVQELILSEVPDNCRNLSAFVWSRIKAVKG